MKNIIVALAQINATVGALDANVNRMVKAAETAAENNASLVVFPELALCGYPPEDLILKPHFLRDCEKAILDLQTKLPANTVTVIGTPHREGNSTYNGAAVFANGQLAGIYHKISLPNYGVFDEKRIFTSGTQAMILDINGALIGLHLCEDSWVLDSPACKQLMPLELDGLLNLSASPYERRKLALREGVLRETAEALQTHVLYCNLAGGQDELVFDGASMILAPDGNLLARAAQFKEEILYFSLPVRLKQAEIPPGNEVNRIQITLEINDSETPPQPAVYPALDEYGEIYAALKTGLRDYVDKNCFRKTVVALSGGIDSALVAAIAVDALGADRVAGVTMPSQYTSDGTLSDAGLLAENLGIEFHTVAIEELYNSFMRELTALWPGKPADTTEENLQARIRANIIMALSNKFGWMVLTTGNKSELAMGYCTLYGDMVGGLAVIKDLPKTLVFELARWRNSQSGGAVIPPSTIERPPSAELRPDQKDTDSLPPYEILDPILELYIEQQLGLDEIIAKGFEKDMVEKVVRTVDRNEYKRRQGAPGIKITQCAFGRERRMPITNQYLN